MPLLVRERPLTAVIIAVGGAAALFLLVALWRYWRRRFPAIRWRMRVARLAVVLPALAFFVSIMDFATFSWTRDRLQIIPIMWDQKENYASNGFAIAFALNVPMAKVKAPPSYEDDVLDAITARADRHLDARRKARHHRGDERILLGSDAAARAPRSRPIRCRTCAPCGPARCSRRNSAA